MRSRAFRSAWLGLLLLLPSGVGCGPGQAKVSGRVLYKGTPLPGGRVCFRPADPRRNSLTVDLDADGNYEAVLPVGDVQVSVDNRELEPRRRPQGMVLPPLKPEVREKLGGGANPEKAPPAPGEDAADKLPGRYVKIPDKYYDTEKSGLQFKVEPGGQRHDIELQP